MFSGDSLECHKWYNLWIITYPANYLLKSSFNQPTEHLLLQQLLWTGLNTGLIQLLETDCHSWGRISFINSLHIALHNDVWAQIFQEMYFFIFSFFQINVFFLINRAHLLFMPIMEGKRISITLMNVTLQLITPSSSYDMVKFLEEIR